LLRDCSAAVPRLFHACSTVCSAIVPLLFCFETAPRLLCDYSAAVPHLFRGCSVIVPQL
ncbi:hypothetical protein KI387_013407, partial [Taxus chinensis]